MLGQALLSSTAPGNLSKSAGQRPRSAAHQNAKRLKIQAVAVPATPGFSRNQAHSDLDANQLNREGSHEASLVQRQAAKIDPEQPSISTVLLPLDPSAIADVAVVGCGPAGLALSAELAKQGLSVALIGNDRHIVNNYGVWLDEFKALGLENTLDAGGWWVKGSPDSTA
jgi:lycopene epsilon-cyclase